MVDIDPWDSTVGGQVRAIDVPHADAYDQETSEAATDRLYGQLAQIELLADELDDNVAGAVAALTENGDGAAFALLAGRLAEVRRKLALT